MCLKKKNVGQEQDTVKKINKKVFFQEIREVLEMNNGII